jgi:hypothetical protein
MSGPCRHLATHGRCDRRGLGFPTGERFQKGLFGYGRRPGSPLLRNVKVAAATRTSQLARSERVGIGQDRLLAELAFIAGAAYQSERETRGNAQGRGAVTLMLSFLCRAYRRERCPLGVGLKH